MELGDPTTLIIIDEADRLRMAGLEQVRAIFDTAEIGVILIGMPGLEKRILEVNSLREVTKAVVEAARESLVIGKPNDLDQHSGGGKELWNRNLTASRRGSFSPHKIFEQTCLSRPSLCLMMGNSARIHRRAFLAGHIPPGRLG